MLPLPLGSEAAGIVTAVGDGAVGPAGPVSVGDEVILYPAAGAYADRIVVDADATVPKPPGLTWEEAAGLLLASVTALDTLDTVGVRADSTVLIHGASGAVGAAAVQLAVRRGAYVIGTAAARNHEYVRDLGAIPVVYGDGLADRVRALAPNGIDAAVDTVGTREAVEVSVELVPDRSSVVTIAAGPYAEEAGIVRVGGPESVEVRRRMRLPVTEIADSGGLSVRVARTFPLDEAARAHTELRAPHPPGKFVLLP